jgi:hypothetical protein
VRICAIREIRGRADAVGRLMRIKKINIQSAIIPRLKEFYGVVLQLKIEEHADSLIIYFGESVLQIEEADEGEPFYYFAINIPFNKIEEAREWLMKKVELLWMEDYKSDVADFINWHAKSVYFFDPAGNIVELIARFDLRNESREPFSSNHFLSISEIGIVFPEKEIEKNTEAILKQTQLGYFLKQSPMSHFKVVGDDEGLFIIVTEKRNWYPTSKPSGIFPLEIIFETENGVEVLRY